MKKLLFSMLGLTLATLGLCSGLTAKAATSLLESVDISHAVFELAERISVTETSESYDNAYKISLEEGYYYYATDDEYYSGGNFSYDNGIGPIDQMYYQKRLSNFTDLIENNFIIYDSCGVQYYAVNTDTAGTDGGQIGAINLRVKGFDEYQLGACFFLPMATDMFLLKPNGNAYLYKLEMVSPVLVDGKLDFGGLEYEIDYNDKINPEHDGWKLYQEEQGYYKGQLKPGLYIAEDNGTPVTKEYAENNNLDVVGSGENVPWKNVNFAYDQTISLGNCGKIININLDATENHKNALVCIDEYKDVFIAASAVIQDGINIYRVRFKNTDTSDTDIASPEFEGTATFVVNVDNMLSFDSILSHVSAVDETDGEVEVVRTGGTYNPENRVLGDYTMEVEASDAAGNTATATLAIKVVDTTAPTITASNKTVGNSTGLTEDELKALFTYEDNYDKISDLTFEFVDDYYSGATVPGDYEVLVRVIDKSGNVSETATAVITVTDTTKPTINASNTTVKNNVELTEDELRALFTYSDDHSSEYELTLTIDYSAYTAGKKHPGQYEVIGTVTDDAGNSASATAIVTVTDGTAPTITATDATQSYTTALTEDELKALFTLNDDHSEVTNLTLTLEDNYTAKYNVKGTYTVIGTVVDEAGNSASATALVTVMDDVKPIISAPGSLTCTSAALMSIEEIKSRISVTDGYDGEISFELIDNDNYSANVGNVGTYTFTINALDESNNKATATLTITVTDGIAPEIYVDSYFIILQEGDTLTDEQIKEYAAKSLGVAVTDIAYITGEYNSQEAGTYDLNVTLKNGKTSKLTIAVDAAPKAPTGNFFEDQPALAWSIVGVITLIAVAAVVIVIKKKRH